MAGWVGRGWLLLVLALAGGCAAGRGADPVPPTGSEEACFSVHRLKSIAPLHERFIWVEVRGGRSFLLTLEQPCWAALQSTQLSFESDFTRICDGGRAWLVYAAGSGLGRCRVLHVERVADRAEAERLVAERAPGGRR